MYCMIIRGARKGRLGYSNETLYYNGRVFPTYSSRIGDGCIFKVNSGLVTTIAGLVMLVGGALTYFIIRFLVECVGVFSYTLRKKYSTKRG